MTQIRFNARPDPLLPNDDDPPRRGAALLAALIATTLTLGSTLALLAAALPYATL